jgi:tetratricopeptide (TPR) repeat protein
MPVDAGLEAGRQAALHALDLDPDLVSAHVALAGIESLAGKDLMLAASHIQKAFVTSPNDVEILRPASHMLRMLGRTTQAAEVSRTIVDRDPLNPSSHITLAVNLYFDGQWDESLKSFDRAIRLNPNNIVARVFAAQALLMKGDAQTALTMLNTIGDRESWSFGFAAAYSVLGESEQAEHFLSESIETMSEDSAYNIAYTMAFVGDADGAFEWLDRAAEQSDPGLNGAHNEPFLWSLHDDPRWLPFLESVGQSEEDLDSISFDLNFAQVAK